jgi:hypothetical protein
VEASGKEYVEKLKELAMGFRKPWIITVSWTRITSLKPEILRRWRIEAPDLTRRGIQRAITFIDDFVHLLR